MAEYADPVIDWLDQDNLISQRFFRQVTYNKQYHAKLLISCYSLVF